VGAAAGRWGRLLTVKRVSARPRRLVRGDAGPSQPSFLRCGDFICQYSSELAIDDSDRGRGGSGATATSPARPSKAPRGLGVSCISTYSARPVRTPVLSGLAGAQLRSGWGGGPEPSGGPAPSRHRRCAPARPERTGPKGLRATSTRERGASVIDRCLGGSKGRACVDERRPLAAREIEPEENAVA